MESVRYKLYNKKRLTELRNKLLCSGNDEYKNDILYIEQLLNEKMFLIVPTDRLHMFIDYDYDEGKYFPPELATREIELSITTKAEFPKSKEKDREFVKKIDETLYQELIAYLQGE